MSLFPRGFLEPDVSFTPLFRLLDDFDNYSRVQGRGGQQTKLFSPKFDVHEVADSYNLHGELPGVEPNNVEIEFTDPQVLTIRGRSERSYVSDNAGLLEGQKEEGKEKDKKKQNGEGAVTTTAGNKKGDDKPEEKFWVSERTVGEFARSFNFPEPVDQDNVKASMNNGILSLVIPKAKKEINRKKITISS